MTEIRVRDFAPGDETPFRELNEAWIREYFAIEEKDAEVLNDPVGQIILNGGEIIVAERDGRVLGCCALLPHGPGCYELGKMAVAPETRGQGIGKQILQYAIRRARDKRASRLYLETNSKLQNAIHVYESAGFRHLPDGRVQTSPYARSNVAMELLLEETAERD